nr:hypothetical protein [Chloroflexota bacterium]
MANNDQTRTRGAALGRTPVDNMTVAPVEAVTYGRETRETETRNVTQVMNLPSDRVRWGPIWAGLLAAFFTLLVL